MTNRTTRSSRSSRAAWPWALGALALSVLPPALLSGPAGAQVAAAEADYGGYATGTVVHAHALQSGDTRVTDAEVAFSGAAADSRGLAEAVQNEMQRVVQPPLADKNSYGRGSAFELGLVQEPSGENSLVLADLAEASAPPDESETVEIGPVDADPLAWASLLRGAATARWAPDSCVLGADISNGLGYAADAQLLDSGEDEAGEGLDSPVLSTDAPSPQRAVSQATSRVRLVPQTARDGTVEGPNLGVMTETRMTIAPVTLFAGSEQQLTIEFAGEWVMRAVATGLSGYVHYGPGEVSPETPVVRIIDATNEVVGQLTTQDLLGEEGLVIDQIPGVEIALGEDPRAIGGDAASAPTETPTLSSAAVDVARVRVFDPEDPTSQVVDVRVGHMEVRTEAPAGGIVCPGITVDKRAEPEVVSPGEQFVYTITVVNPYDCTLTNVRVEDSITTTPGIVYDIVSSDPAADQTRANGLTWNDVGPIPPKGSRELKVTIKVADDSGGGRFVNEAVATAVCGLDSAQGEAQVEVPVEGRVRIELPTVAATLPATGTPVPVVVPWAAGALAAGLLLLRRLRRAG